MSDLWRETMVAGFRDTVMQIVLVLPRLLALFTVPAAAAAHAEGDHHRERGRQEREPCGPPARPGHGADGSVRSIRPASRSCALPTLRRSRC